MFSYFNIVCLCAFVTLNRKITYLLVWFWAHVNIIVSYHEITDTMLAAVFKATFTRVTWAKCGA